MRSKEITGSRNPLSHKALGWIDLDCCMYIIDCNTYIIDCDAIRDSL